VINVLVETFLGLMPRWLSISIVAALSLLAFLVAVLAAILLIQAVLRIRWKSQTVRRFVRIVNQGNSTGKFLLRVDGPQKDLRFQLLLDGNELPDAPAETPKTQTAAAAQAARAANTVQRSIPVNGEQAAQAAPATADESKQKAVEAAAKAKAKAQKGLGVGRLFSGILGTLGSLLPGSMGASLKQKSADLQQVTQAANTKMQMPEQSLKSVEHLKGQVGQLKPGAQVEKPVPAATLASPAASDRPVLLETEVEMVQPAAGRRSSTVEKTSSGFLQTPPLAPGESISLELRMDPIHSYRSGEYGFAVLVRQPAPGEDRPDSTTRGRLVIKGLSRVYWILSFMLIACAVVLNGTWAILLIRWLTGFLL
jgi:hypothetical protein